MNLTPLQLEILRAKEQFRFRVAILGRRSGKTTLAIEDILDSCWSNPNPKEWPLAYIAPTYKQAKRISWARFKQHFQPKEVRFKESELSIQHLPTGCNIYLLGCDTNADAIRGVGLWHSVVDELKDIGRPFLQEVLRPCFSDTGAGCLYIGTPGAVKGVDYEYYQRGRLPQWADWASWNKGSAEAGLLLPSEIDLAKKELDPDVFKREYGAAFSFREGLVVKFFSNENIAETELQPNIRLHLSCDFNVDPCMWVVGQRIEGRYYVLDEIVLENTTVVEMVDAFAKRYPPHLLQAGLTLNGDASGHNRSVHSSRKNQTCYTLMRNRLAELGYEDVRVSVPSANPPVQDRIEAFNAKVMNANGEVFLWIHPRCKWLIWNLETLHWIEGTSQIWEPTSRDIQEDKKRKFTKHIYDAVSYWVSFYDPIRQKSKVAEGPNLWVPDLEFGV